MDKDLARSDEPGSHAAHQAQGLGPSGFDPSRRSLAFEAIVNAGRIHAIAQTAQEARQAEYWLSTYGTELANRKDNFSLAFRAEYAGSCSGSAQANAYIRNAVVRMMPAIVASAREAAIADIEAIIAIATDTGTAETSEAGSVHEGAGPEGHRPDTGGDQGLRGRG